LGNLKGDKSLSIVGTRHPTQEGKKKAYEFGKALSEKGYIIISGGAEGIDTYAHKGALEGPSPVGLILGEGILTALKNPSKRKLIKEILKKDGFIVSQFFPTEKGSKWTFPRRNYIIAALSTDGCLIISAPAKSGSLITAEYCRLLNKPLYVYIGYAPHKAYRGCVNLLEKGVAQFVANPEELLNKISPATPAPSLNLSLHPPDDKTLILRLLEEKPKTFDELYIEMVKEKGEYDEAELNLLLGELLIEGKISLVGAYYQII